MMVVADDERCWPKPADAARLMMRRRFRRHAGGGGDFLGAMSRHGFEPRRRQDKCIFSALDDGGGDIWPAASRLLHSGRLPVSIAATSTQVNLSP